MVNVTQANVNSLTLVNNTTYILTEDVVIINIDGFGGNNMIGVVFDGNGHKITVDAWNFVGLFGSGENGLGTNMLVKNLKVEKGANGSLLVGAGWFFKQGSSFSTVCGNIENCTSTGNIYDSVQNCGGFYGQYCKGNISFSYFTGKIGYQCGGIFGAYAQPGSTINFCYTNGDIGAFGVNGNDAGGLVGAYSNGIAITNSYVSGIIYGSCGYVAGVSSSNLTISNFYSSSFKVLHNGDYGKYLTNSTQTNVLTEVGWSDINANSVLSGSPDEQVRSWYSNVPNTHYVFLRDYVPSLTSFTIDDVDVLTTTSITRPYRSGATAKSATALSGTVTYSPASAWNLGVGPNIISATVTDEGKTQTYTRTVTIQGDTSATITVNQSTYAGEQITVSSVQTAVIIGVTPENSAATFSGSGLKQLNTGLNTFTVTLNAQYGATQNYIVNVYRQSAATTATISINGAAVTSGSTVNIPYGTTSVPVSVSNVASGATYIITGDSNLNVGNNTLSVIVTAEDTAITQTYTYTIIRAGSSDTSLSTFTINGQTVQDNSTVTANASSVTVVATPTHSGASAVVSGASGLVVGNNTVSVLVTAQDGSTATYNVTVVITNILANPVISVSDFTVPNVGKLYTKLYTFSGVSSGLTASPEGIVQISGNTAKVVGVGTCTISKAVNGITYSYVINADKFKLDKESTVSVGSYTQSFNASVKLIQNIDDLQQYMTSNSLQYSLSISPITYTSNNTDIATVSSTGFVTIISTGSVIITASYSGDSLFEATSFDNTYDVVQSKSSQIITFVAISDKIINDSVTLNAIASSGLDIEYDITSEPVDGVFTMGQGDTIQLIGAGTITVTAQQLGNEIYNAAPLVSRTFTVSKKTQTITVSSAFVKPIGSKFNMNATVNSGLILSYTSNNSGIASVSTTGEVTANSAGTTTITVSQAGNNVWAEVSQNIDIIIKSITLPSALIDDSLPQNEEVFTTINNISAVAKKQAPTNGSVTYAPADTSIMPVTVAGLPSSIANVSIATSAPVAGVVKFVIDAHTAAGVNTHDFTASPLTLTFKIPGINAQTWYKIEKRSAESGNIVNRYTVKSTADGTVVLSNVKSLCEFTATPFESTTVPCFVAGTKILTTAGYKAVEKLSNADRIITADGRSVTFKLYSTYVAKTTKETAPYVIKAGAFGRSSPAADITLSPHHAIQSAKGVWQIPKYAAITNDNLRQVSIGESVTYYHIELPNYFTDNIVAEGGVVVESFGAKQIHGVKNVYKYNAMLSGFTRKSHGVIKRAYN